MAKSRKRRKRTPNISQTALERARRQLEEATDDAEPEAEEADTPDVEEEERLERQQRRERRRERVESDAFQYSRRKDKGELDRAEIEEKLAHPTQFVTEAELREEYRHVIKDLTSMGILAVGLMGLLVVLAQFI